MCRLRFLGEAGQRSAHSHPPNFRHAFMLGVMSSASGLPSARKAISDAISSKAPRASVTADQGTS